MHDKLKAQLIESHFLRRGMRPNLADAAEPRWLLKPVSNERRIPLAAEWERIRLQGPGMLGVDAARSHSGEGSLSLNLPTVQPVKHPNGRAFSVSEWVYPFENEDLTAYNRISLWVYVDSEVSPATYMNLTLHNAGPNVMPVPGRFEGFHSFTLEGGRWHRVVWEMPNVSRNRVTAISVGVHGNGTPIPFEPRITVLFDDLRLQTVEIDSYKGFDLRPKSIAYCHSGYRAGDVKQALVRQAGSAFELRDAEGQAVYSGTGTPDKDGYARLDFTDFTREGWYTLHSGGLSSGPFPIGEEAYLAAAWKTLNFFFVERCGFNVPQVHTECHLDVMSVHPDGRKRCVSGGWHDAGDLTQDGRNSADIVQAMLELGDAARKKQPQLASRALEEARWGLDWLMRVRWGDGYRHCGQIIGFWTDNTLGTFDDIEKKAEYRPFDNLQSAGVFARASVIFREDDPAYARLCARIAREDLFFGIDGMHREALGSAATPLELSALAAASAAELYIAVGGEETLAQAARFAREIMACQQRQVQPGFSLPLRGYFFESSEKKRAQVYFHRSYEHIPVQALARLLEAAPSHPDAPQWRQSLALYGEYLREMYPLTAYGVLPNGVYELDNTDYSTLYHEGDRSRGGPSLEEYNAQVKNGIKLDERNYLRIFPVSYQFRGFHATIMGKALAALAVGRALGDAGMRPIAVRQMEWMLGYNPFALSSVYGEGYDFHPLYSGLMPQIVGAVPVGFQTWENEDIPYWPVQNLATYKEIWGHTTSRLMRLIAGLGF